MGAGYGCDMEAAVQTARRLGIPIETIDVLENFPS
jgi:pheromone shutdown protein TraB